MKKALITGINGQDGSYLTKLLIDKGYEVHGIIRKASTFNTERLDALLKDPDIAYKRLHLHFGDLTDSSNLNRILNKVKPDELYNLAAQSHVKVSFDMPEYTADVDALGTIRLLDAMKDTGIDCRFYQASTSELFGGLLGTAPQNENTPFAPRSPYACAKLFAYWSVINYREAYNMFACNGILYNHESPYRLETFVTQKIVKAAVRIKNGTQDVLNLGNLNAIRDWGFAGDYVKAMWMMLQQEKPDDYVIATGKGYTVKYFVEAVFSHLDIEIIWEGEGLEEIGIDKATGKTIVKVDSRFFRPTEVEVLIGDASKAQKQLDWQPMVDLNFLIFMMVSSETQKQNKS